MEICTSGTSGISAERFFLRLKDSKVSAIIDTRLHPNSQLAGYAKQDSLKYFAKEILNITYVHEQLLCPKEIDLQAYRNEEIDWHAYEVRYKQLLSDRDSFSKIDFSLWGARPLILCSEETPDYCHRRLAADYLNNHLGIVTEIKHL
jgi:uncharacterized protein (DUF488 family)